MFYLPPPTAEQINAYIQHVNEWFIIVLSYRSLDLDILVLRAKR